MYTIERAYTNFNGDEVTGVFRFNLTEAELSKLYLVTEGGLEDYIQKITEEHDNKKLIEIYEQLIDMSYGEKTADGDFMKSPEILAKFKAKAVYSDLYMEWLTDADKAAEFINGITSGIKKKKPLPQPQDHLPAKKVTPINK